MRGGLVVCGATSDAGKSWVVAGLCRLLSRQGVSVAPFKAQNMALNAAVTADGGEIGHAQWIQAVAAGIEPEIAMNPVLLKPCGERTSEVIVRGKVVGLRSTSEHHASVEDLRPVVLETLADLRRRFDVVVCEGAGGAAEINLLDRDLANLPLALAAGLPAVVVADIDRGGVFASLFGTHALVPDDLRSTIRGFVINRLRGDASLLDPGIAELERRTGVPVLGVLPMVEGTDLDAEDSLALERWHTGATADGPRLDVAAIRLPHVANIGDLDPLRLEPAVSVRWVSSAAELGRPHLVVVPGSKRTRDDLDWIRRSGLSSAIDASGAAVVGICAGMQMLGTSIEDPGGVEGEAGVAAGLGWLDVATRFEPEKVLDRPTAVAVDGPGQGTSTAGYRIHLGRVRARPGATPWLAAGEEAIGWWSGRFAGTSLHGLFESDSFRAGVLTWAAAVAGVPAPALPAVSFGRARQDRLDRIADVLDAHLDRDAVERIIAEGAPASA